MNRTRGQRRVKEEEEEGRDRKKGYRRVCSACYSCTEFLCVMHCGVKDVSIVSYHSPRLPAFS